MKLITPLFLSCMLLLSCKGDNKGSNALKNDPAEVNDVSSAEEQKDERKTILFFGNSLTAGLGLDKSESFPSLIQDRIDSLGMNYRVINAGLSGETSSNGATRIDWVIQQTVDVFVLELGANDMLRGLDLQATEDNLRAILSSVQSKYPDAKLLVCGMQSPPNMGPDYVDGFANLFVDLAKEFDAGFIPFFLEGVAGIEGMTLDGKHPTAEGQKIVRDNIWKVLRKYL